MGGVPSWEWAGGAHGWVAGRAGYWVFLPPGGWFVVSVPRLWGTQPPLVTQVLTLHDGVKLDDKPLT